jgi:hypothetical protein
MPLTPKPSSPAITSKTLYVIIFGYPPDKYSVTVEYFRAFGETTEADPNVEISNCFRIGYTNPADAMRAVRKNGDIISGSFMIGVKWAVSLVLATSVHIPSSTFLGSFSGRGSPGLSCRSKPFRCLRRFDPCIARDPYGGCCSIKG